MPQKRYAYLMGANGSSMGKLHYAERDAKRLANALNTTPCAFTKVEGIIAADRQIALKGLKQFTEQCHPEDLLLVHFSGHAIYDEELYLLCNDTDSEDLISSAIKISDVKAYLRKCKARHKALVLDCCHSGGAHMGTFKGEEEMWRDLHDTMQGSASIILSACARGERTRELEVLDGGSGFLSWAFITACTSSFSTVTSDGVSLSLADIWRWIPKALREVNVSLSEKDRLPEPKMISEMQGGDCGDFWLTDQRRNDIANDRIYTSQDEKELRLRALLADHSGFIQDRLSSFVGRANELKEVQQRIAELQPTGGYITITGKAGQGKSSIIAKLASE